MAAAGLSAPAAVVDVSAHRDAAGGGTEGVAERAADGRGGRTAAAGGRERLDLQLEVLHLRGEGLDLLAEVAEGVDRPELVPVLVETAE